MRRHPSSPPGVPWGLLVFAILLASPVSAATEYHWVGASTAEFGTPTNWNPVRTTPAADDRLVFDGGGDYTVMNPTTATIGQFIVEHPTRLVISANTGFGGRQISIAGGPGTDFEMEPGTHIRIAGDKPISFVIRSGATASISGWYVIDTNPAFQMFNQFIAEDPEAIQFMAGSVFELREGMFSNPFSNGLSPDVPNMVRFRAASTYIHGCALPPPITDVVFDPDSRYIHVDEGAPSFVGRTYGDFEYYSPLTQTITGNGNFTVGDLMVTQGRLNLAVVGEGIVTDHIIALPGAYLRLGATSGTLNLRLVGGTAGQQILQNPNNGAGGAGLTTTSGLRLIVDNPWGVRFDFGVPLDFAGVLEFRRGVVTAPFGGANVVRLRYGGTTTGASPSTGWIHGAVWKDLPPGQPTETIPVGTATEYTPITLAFQGVLADTTVVSAVVQSPGDPPAQPLADSSFTGAQIDTTKKVNLHWAFSFVSNDFLPTTVSPPTFGVELGFQAANLDPGADWTNFVPRLRTIGTEADTNNSWRGAAGMIVVPGPNSMGLIGVQGDHPSDYFFMFAVGEPSVVNVTVQDPAVEEGGAALRTGPGPEGSATSLAFRVSLSEPAVETITVDYMTAAGSAEEGADFTGVDGTLTFPPGDTVKIVDVPIVGEGAAENHETLSLVLSNATGAVIADGEGEGTILDDDDVTPPTASVVYPNGGETLIEGSTVDLQWTASDNVTVAALKLFYSTDGGTSWLLIASDVPNSGSYSWQVPTGLTQNALFRIRAYDHHGRMAVDESDASWWIWNVDGVEPVVPGRFAFDVASANPTAGAMRFRLALTRDQAVRMLVHDVRGRLVGVPVDERRPAGAHLLEWSGRGVGAGVYFVTMESEEGSAVRRVVRLR